MARRLQLDFFDALDQLDLWPTRWVPQPTYIGRPNPVELQSIESRQVAVCERSGDLLCRRPWALPTVYDVTAYSGLTPLEYIGIAKGLYLWTCSPSRGFCALSGRASEPSGASACHVGSNCTQSCGGSATTGDSK